MEPHSFRASERALFLCVSIPSLLRTAVPPYPIKGRAFALTCTKDMITAKSCWIFETEGGISPKNVGEWYSTMLVFGSRFFRSRSFLPPVSMKHSYSSSHDGPCIDGASTHWAARDIGQTTSGKPCLQYVPRLHAFHVLFTRESR